jgi:hypothetical protein
MNTNTETGGLVEEAVVDSNYTVYPKEKLVRMKVHLSKLMRLVTNSLEQEGNLYTQLMLKLLEVYVILDNAEKGETNVGRNSTYPE